jgi:hypothetical protein
VSPAVACPECLCSGRVLPSAPPWDRFLPGVCANCNGMQWIGCVPLSSLPVGSVYADANGKEYRLVRRHPGGEMGVSAHDGSEVWAEPRKGLPVRLVEVSQ